MAPSFVCGVWYGGGMGATDELMKYTRDAATAAGVPFELLAGLVQTESGWNPTAVSGAGARGLTQVMPWWLTSDKFKKYGLTPDDLFNPETALWIGSEILADELRRFGGDWALAAMAYNGGSPMVTKAIAKAGTQNAEAVSEKIPSAETRGYWQKVLNWSAYFADQISVVEAKAVEVSQDAQTWVQGQGGAVLIILAVIGLAVMGGKRG